METTLSSKGQIVLPCEVRRKLGLRPGTKFSSRVVRGSIILTPQSRPQGRPRLSRDAATGLMVTAAPDSGAAVTSRDVRALLADFP